MQQAQNGCVLAYKFKGQRFDCGSVEGYIEATNYCFENIYNKPSQNQVEEVPAEKVA
jgi:UTP--glucose-1-phosphate uridylyltransferase